MNWILDTYSNVYQTAMMQSKDAEHLAAPAKDRINARRTQLFGLQDEIQVRLCQPLAYRLGTMADHHLDAVRLQLPSGVDHMTKHGFASHRVQHLGQG